MTIEPHDPRHIRSMIDRDAAHVHTLIRMADTLMISLTQISHSTTLLDAQALARDLVAKLRSVKRDLDQQSDELAIEIHERDDEIRRLLEDLASSERENRTDPPEPPGDKGWR